MSQVSFYIRFLSLLLVFGFSTASSRSSITKLGRQPLQIQEVRTELLLDAMRMSSLAYQDVNKITAAYKSNDKESSGIPAQNSTILEKVSAEPIQYNNDITQASFTTFQYKYDKQSPEKLVVAYQGSDDPQDWLNDALVFQVPFRPLTFKGLNAHAGFVTAFESLAKESDPYVKKAIQKGQEILVTGHSLGSALAFLAAAHYDNLYPKQIQYIGFATPRVGNPKFAEYINEKFPVFPRVKYGSDPVTKIPYKELLLSKYQHAGQEYHIGKVDKKPDDFDLLDIKDHTSESYITSLEQSPKVIVTSPK